jgi:putative NIF3 family GTP cyclohydrolase 1 type 2
VTARLDDVMATLEHLYPASLAEDWDAVGLVCGDPQAPVRRVLLAVDPVEAVVDEVLDGGYDLLITHHPLFLRGTTSVAATTPKGRVVHRLLTAGAALHVAHTNADSADPGVSDALASLFDLQDLRPLQPADAEPLDKLVVFVPVEGRSGCSTRWPTPGAAPIGDYDAAPGPPPAGDLPAARGRGPRHRAGRPDRGRREDRLEVVLPRSRRAVGAAGDADDAPVRGAGVRRARARRAVRGGAAWDGWGRLPAPLPLGELTAAGGAGAAGHRVGRARGRRPRHRSYGRWRSAAAPVTRCSLRRGMRGRPTSPPTCGTTRPARRPRAWRSSTRRTGPRVAVAGGRRGPAAGRHYGGDRRVDARHRSLDARLEEPRHVKADPFVQLRLLELQALDSGLDRLAHRRRTLPELAELERLDAQLDALRDAVVRAETEVSDLGRETAKFEREIEQVRARRDRDEGRLSSGAITVAKQLQDLEHEVATLRRRQSELEDSELEVMERAETAQAELDRLSRSAAVTQRRGPRPSSGATPRWSRSTPSCSAPLWSGRRSPGRCPPSCWRSTRGSAPPRAASARGRSAAGAAAAAGST